MKRLILTIFIAVLFTSCVKRADIRQTPPIEDINDLRTVETTTLLSLADDHYKNKEYESCGDLLDTILKREPGNYKAGLLKGRLFTSLERYDEAIAIFKGLMKDFTHKYELHYYAGRAYEQQKFYSLALGEYKTSYQQENDNRFIVKKITDLYMRSQKYGDAITFFHKYLVRHEKNHYVRYNLAMSYFYSNNYNYAIDQLKLIIRYAPDYSLAYYGTGYIYYNFYRRTDSASYKNLAVKNLRAFLDMDSSSYYKNRARSMLRELGN